MSPRRPPPPLLDPLTAADRLADAWLAERGVRWRWPRMQGAQPQQQGATDDDAELVRGAAARARGQVVRDPTTEALEGEQTLLALLAAGQVDAAWHRTQAPPATCGDASDDAPALPVADAAALAGRSLRTVQTRMRELAEIECAGQLVLPGVPPAAGVYAARRGGAGVEGAP